MAKLRGTLRREQEALGAQRKRREERMCKRKTGYATREDAENGEGRVYRCPFCGLWHRTEGVR